MTGFAEEPRASYSARMSKAEFFAWLQAKEGGRYELKNGDIVVHAGSRHQHARLSSRFLTSIARQLDMVKWLAVMADFAVEIGDDIRYPDVLVARAGSDPSALSTNAPGLIVEVLSPSSTARDMIHKLAEYASLPSLQAYIVASQDEAIVWVWHRDQDTRAFPAQPVEIAGPDGVITVTALGVTLPLAEVYRGLTGA
jgi:Uma2 family endonuclease